MNQKSKEGKCKDLLELPEESQLEGEETEDAEKEVESEVVGKKLEPAGTEPDDTKSEAEAETNDKFGMREETVIFELVLTPKNEENESDEKDGKEVAKEQSVEGKQNDLNGNVSMEQCAALGGYVLEDTEDKFASSEKNMDTEPTEKREENSDVSVRSPKHQESLGVEEQPSRSQRKRQREENDEEPEGNTSKKRSYDPEEKKEGIVCLGGIQGREREQNSQERRTEQQLRRRLKDIRREQEELEERRDENRREAWRRWDELQGAKEHIRRDLEDLEDDFDKIQRSGNVVQKEKEKKLDEIKEKEKKLEAVKKKQREIHEQVEQFQRKTRDALDELQSQKRQVKTKLRDIEEEREAKDREAKMLKLNVKKESLK